jgi:histidyl-tRNA synthetase
MNNNSTNLSKLPYKGTSDIYPEDMKTLQYIFNTWRKVAKRFGYEEYDTPLIEDANLYKIKSGEEIANNQLYSFTDKGGREIAIRPELTPSLARMIAQKKKELTFPIRWFNIGRFYRYEKPQRGRSREFFQLNIDLLGTSSVGAELEILQYILAVMDEFNAPKETYEIKLNSRYLLDYLLEKILKVDENLKNDVLKAIDNYLKMERDDFIEYIKDIGLDNEQSSSLMDFLNWSIEDVEKIDKKSRGIKDLLELFRIIKDQGLSNITFSPYIVRGLQYSN